MPILPIDLQTLFSQLNQVGKEQSTQKEAPPLQQALQAAQITKRTAEQDASVNQSRQVSEGTEKVKDRPVNRQRGRRQRREQEKPTVPRARREVLRDPELGHHVDITG